jgi:hypothetical protein
VVAAIHPVIQKAGVEVNRFFNRTKGDHTDRSASNVVPLPNENISSIMLIMMSI